MKAVDHSLSNLLQSDKQDLKLERNFLKDRVVDTLRGFISTGRIPEGTKLTEREISRMLGISRMPVHDALIILETEGLVVRRGNGRYVITLDEKDVDDLHFIRRELEMVSVKLAALNVTPKSRAHLWEKLMALERATEGGDHLQIAKFDLALHRSIWELADNKYLLDILNSLMGVIYVLNDRVVQAQTSGGYDNTISEHRSIVELITSGEGEAASTAIGTHLDNAHRASLETFGKPDTQIEEN